MHRSSIPTLADLLEYYYQFDDLMALAALFDVKFNEVHVFRTGGVVCWIEMARQMVERLDHGNHRGLMEAVLEQLDSRNVNGLAHRHGDGRAAHENYRSKIARLNQDFASGAGIPHEVATPGDRPYTAKAEVREFVARADTEILLVDPYIGVGTLDCLRSTYAPIRLLTGTRPNSIEDGFPKPLEAFRAEGHRITIRQHDRLHDRHFVFNDRCWLVGSSLRDAGKKAFHVMEIVDSKAEITTAIEAKWTEGTQYPCRLGRGLSD
jgi:hypothetical protein